MAIILNPIGSLTVGSLILKALNLLGIEEAGDVATDDDLTLGLEMLNLFLDRSSIDPGKLYVRIEDVYTLMVGKGAYTIGPDFSADINTAIPERVSQAYIKNTAVGIDYWMDVTMSQEEYNAMPLKNIQTIPTRILHLKQYPYAQIIFNYLPNLAYELHLFSWKPFVRFNDYNQGILLPSGYEAWMAYNLAVSMAPAFGKEAAQSVVMIALDTAKAIDTKNYEIPHVQLQGVPGAGAMRNRTSIFNPFVR